MTPAARCLWMLAVALCQLLHSAEGGGLSEVHVTVPMYRMPGQMAEMQCDYELGEDTLYSVKWYKDHEEFYRFVPKARPPQHSYKLEGLQVDLSKSDSRKVYLRSVTFKSSGLYRCEVSAEAPSFASAQSEARMDVVFMPTEDPSISGVVPQYRIGDEIDLNCTSGKSHPAPKLYWYINEQQVTSPVALIRYPESAQGSQGLVSSRLGLRFRLGAAHFVGGSMRVRCVASVVTATHFHHYHDTLVHRLSSHQYEHAPHHDNREALLLVRSASGHPSLSVLLFLSAIVSSLT